MVLASADRILSGVQRQSNKISGVDVQVPVRPAIFLLTIVVIYTTISFWFESQKVLRLNSHFVAGKEIGDTVSEVRSKLEEASAYLDRVGSFDFGPMPNEAVLPVVEDFKQRSRTYIDYLANLQATRGGMNLVDGKKSFTNEEAIHIDNLVEVLSAYERRLEAFPFSEIDPDNCCHERPRSVAENAG